ncbi:helix-turn-helix domain-containing protein [Nostoc sp. UCD121]|uniref:helix-turn-helix domain-containing protein n=1 Tax=unclassified Nostoc TaxID=2593658 RepID=UPI0016272DDC|nr:MULTISPECIES: helix-turn-helix domain-containing protein [unclassified Nostoc]MBC1221092.1 helix-turn-helix domain-containing protein [Nostoc sp. UCD120]MBC1280055.1 helix-turn-helix domain-containing protein [Nostoc sp. UCD121]MBC1294530.1 helix-turn-helix domain-containing protein [Nostoc sp. UCD122]
MSIKWTGEELIIIETKAEIYTIKQIASILKRRGYQRTPFAIYLKLNNLGYSARPTLDNYSCKEIAQVLQLNFSTVTRWVKRGWLKATRRSARHYQIRKWDLKQFFDNPPQSIKKRIAALDVEAINYLLGKQA